MIYLTIDSFGTLWRLVLLTLEKASKYYSHVFTFVQKTVISNRSFIDK